MGDRAVGSVWRFRAFQHLWDLGFRVCAVSIQEFGFQKSLLLDMETCCVRGVMGLKEGVAPSCKVGVSLGLTQQSHNPWNTWIADRSSSSTTYTNPLQEPSIVYRLIEQADGAPSSKSSLNFAQTCHSATCDQENL